MQWIKPKQLTRYLKTELDNGYYRLTWDEIAAGIFGHAKASKQDIIAIRYVWNRTEKQLRKRGICAILVTDFYFEQFIHREPEKPEAIRMCIAGGRGNRAAGVRLLFFKEKKNDPMAIAYLRLRIRVVLGGESAIQDRITIGAKQGSLTRTVARTLSEAASEPALPDHEKDFEDLVSD